MVNQISLLITLSLLIIAAYKDVEQRIIPNVITFPCMFIGLILSCFISPRELIFRLVVLVFFFLFGMFRIIGLGDLKLCMAVIALRGAVEGTFMLLFGAIFLMMYCFATKPAIMWNVLKETALFFTTKKKITKQSDDEYPFGLFLGIGFPAAYIVSNLV